ncbi:MAG: hypothetical protein U0271_42690 [Polyangiaceae bacterium]
MNRTSSLGLLFACVLPLLAGCGADLYQPRTLSDLDPEYEVDDAEIEKAFAANPQMPAAVTVAYYSTASSALPSLEDAGAPRAGDPNDTSLKELLGRLPGVEDVYRIPSLLAEGKPVNDYSQPRGVHLKRLRLAAARAHADVLVIFDHGRVEGSVNGLVAFAPLILPVLFLPMTDTRVKSFLSAYVIDVRNGYFYGQVDATEAGGTEYQTIYASSQRDAEAAREWSSMTTDVEDKLGLLFTDAQNGATAPKASPSVVRAAAAGSSAAGSTAASRSKP